MHYDVPDLYRSFYTDEIKNQVYSTLPEFQFAAVLNQYIEKYSLLCERVKTDQKQYSPYDNHVVEFNYNVLDAGKVVCKIEIEEKSHDTFDVFPNPPIRWTAWSFLSRKVEKSCMGDTDVYVLYTKNDYNNIFWSSFVTIRANCKKIGKEYCDSYYRANINRKFVSTKMMNLANYIITLQQDKKYSTDTATQKTLNCF